MNKEYLKGEILKEIDYYINDNVYVNKKDELIKIKDFVINKPEENKEAVLLCHSGLGDYITHIGAIIYLSFFYNRLYLACNIKNQKNVSSFLKDYDNVLFIDGENCLISKNLLLEKEHKTKDFFRTYLDYHPEKFKTKNIFLRMEKKNFVKVNQFISTFYNNINLSFDVYYNFFTLPITQESFNLYNSVNSYKLIFVHEQASDNTFDFKSKFTTSENDLVVCANRNYYNEGVKKDLAEKFINKPILDYILTILNSNRIIVCDSCFSAIILPYKIRGDIKTDDITIYYRQNFNYENLTNKINFKQITR